MRLLLPLPLILLTAACGPREAGFDPSEILVWELTAASVEFGQCSDSPDWRDSFPAPELAPGSSYFAVGVDSSGTKASQLQCGSFNAASCSIKQNGLTFAVSGTELIAGGNAKAPASEGSTCNLALAETLLIEDLGASMVLTDTLLFTLVDDEVECGEIEDFMKATSQNRLGVNGCAVTIRYEGVLR